MADQFTEEQVEEYKQKFNLFDKDNDGLIEIGNLGTLIRSLGQNPTERELKNLVSEISREDGKVDFSEFLTLLAMQMNNAGDEEELREAFRIFDKDGNGYIKLEELKHIVMTMGEKMSIQEFTEMMNEIEVNGEGKFNYEEFVTNIWSK
ncbi:unnamed protein product [Phyllotreta striolata]|uniref:EF-hand domain-containing protein n=1 Tax=Phyllotreta striolata TaxID=444603 RepID=A0A9N9TPT7_PHYSR|nr:unnamed protein product [Phyllotreta striolata]